MEHLPNLEQHFAEVYRCLKPGGVYRVGGPSGDGAIRKFVADDLEWFGVFPDKRESLGGRFENFIFCRREHLTILTSSFLAELMTAAGFTYPQVCVPRRDTTRRDLFEACLAIEDESDFEVPHTLIVEGTKPAI